LIEAVRYGDRPEVRARLTQAIAQAVDRSHLEELIEERALAHDAMDSSRVARVREEMERAGMGERGSITGLFTVLVEADDMNDPVADATRAILDGHIVLTRELATQNHYPAIDVLESVSRLVWDLLTPEQLELAGRARENLATYHKNRDLINIGAYSAGSSAAIDQAIRLDGPLRQFLRQPANAGFSIAEGWKQLAEAMAQSGGATK
jgi:flagellar biosynthesis/type III secretory pathway ATPase